MTAVKTSCQAPIHSFLLYVPSGLFRFLLKKRGPLFEKPHALLRNMYDYEDIHMLIAEKLRVQN